jgi:SAM-dependent methyltransferase
MSIEGIHEKYVKGRRIHVLGNLIMGFLPPGNASVLDIGSGDGLLARQLMTMSPALSISGIDILVRRDSAIPVSSFDGVTIPHESGSFDYSLLVDVLHHAEKPVALLQEARRVARRGVIIKDHYEQGFLGRRTLMFMDNLGNRRSGVAIPHNYWAPDEWREELDRVGLRAQVLRTRLRLYPAWADWIFGRGLHFAGVFVNEQRA